MAIPDHPLHSAGSISSEPAPSPLGISFGEFLKHPLKVGSAFPASDRMVRRMLAPIKWGAVGLCIEYGPGTGVFTRAILSRLPRSATLLAVDTSREFTRHLQRHIDDPRLRAVAGTAADIEQIAARLGLGQADAILSGLPFSTLPQETAAAIVASSAQLLGPGGHFLAYQMRAAVYPHLTRHFARVDKGFEWWNIPPCHLYWATGPRRSR